MDVVTATEGVPEEMTDPGPHGTRALPGTPGSASTPWSAYRALTRAYPRAWKLGLNLAFCRCFAVPSVARVLMSTGRITGDPLLRAKATGAALFQVLDEGPDSPASLRVLEHLRRVHAGLPVGDDAFVYVLGLFCVHPLRFMAAHGPRRPTAAEEESAHAFCTLLGRRMGIGPLPATYGEFAAAQDAYEERHFGRSPEGLALWAASRRVFRERLPGPFSAIGPLLAEALMGTAAPALGIPARPRTSAVAWRLLRRYLDR
ncbi:oxygenase MpaB family protein [Streptomyces sp. NPDC008238]